MAVKRNPALSVFWKLHVWALRMSNGRLFSKIGGLNVLVLHTIGRKSGEPRSNALNYVEHGKAYAIVATNAGADRHPAWFLNLRAQPRARVEIRGMRIEVKMRAATGKESAEIYEKFVQTDRSYAEYKKRTDREIPVVVLEPTA